MPDLTEAMREALASIERDRPARRGGHAADVQLLDLDGLPPIRHRRYQASSMANLLEEQGGGAWRAGWQVVAESTRMVVLFWGSAIGVAFLDSMSTDGLAGQTMLWSSLGATGVLRGLLAIRGRLPR